MGQVGLLNKRCWDNLKVICHTNTRKTPIILEVQGKKWTHLFFWENLLGWISNLRVGKPFCDSIIWRNKEKNDNPIQVCVCMYNLSMTKIKRQMTNWEKHLQFTQKELRSLTVKSLKINHQQQKRNW